MNSFLLLSADCGSWHDSTADTSPWEDGPGQGCAQSERSVRRQRALALAAEGFATGLFIAGRWDLVSTFQFGKIRLEGLIYILKQLSLEEMML